MRMKVRGQGVVLKGVKTMKKVFLLVSVVAGLLIGMRADSEAADVAVVLDDAAGSSAFSVQDSSSTEWAHIDSNGNMVIKGGLRLDASGVENTTAENLIVDGKVGIGTTSPGALLDVGLAGTTLGVIRLEGSTSGYVDLQPNATAGSVTITLPATTGTAALTANNLSAFAATTSSQLAGVLSDETGTAGKAVFDTSPTISAPTVTGVTTFSAGATIKSTQTTAPTVAAGVALGIGPTVSIQAGSTDMAGRINITAGTTTTTGVIVTVTFNGTYGSAPKAVLLTGNVAASLVSRPWGSSITATTFVVSAAVAPTASAPANLFYVVIE